mmetsp:Transcript_5321/g.8161  ORF Transcript_5321/g.8161 Transcript_5321/m.8161 type:complete len:175 (-) Transcript_5321:87-611(-)
MQLQPKQEQAGCQCHDGGQQESRQQGAQPTHGTEKGVPDARTSFQIETGHQPGNGGIGNAGKTVINDTFDDEGDNVPRIRISVMESHADAISIYQNGPTQDERCKHGKGPANNVDQERYPKKFLPSFSKNMKDASKGSIGKAVDWNGFKVVHGDYDYLTYIRVVSNARKFENLS